MTCDRVLTLLVEFLTHGWPVAAVACAWILRRQIVSVLRRVKGAAAGGFKIDLDDQERLTAATIASAFKPAATPQEALAPEEKDPWRRCGTVYWLGNNIIYTALAIATGNLDAARRELDNAIHHATKLPLHPEVEEKLRNLRAYNWSDPDALRSIVNQLNQLGYRVGVEVVAHQPDFNELDAPRAKRGNSS